MSLASNTTAAVPAAPGWSVLFYQPAPDTDPSDRTVVGPEPWFDTYPVVGWLIGQGQCDPVTPDGRDWTSVAGWRWAIQCPDATVVVPGGATLPNSNVWQRGCAQRDTAARATKRAGSATAGKS